MSEQLHIPGYTLVNKIAEGGMASVWKARQDKLDRVVALKILMKQDDSDHQEYERFIYEARAAASLIHPNIVQVIDAGEMEGFLYYIMEYVPGPTAGDMVDDGDPMPEKQVLQIAQEVSEALDYAWRDHKVVHCDIKPDNLLLHRNGRTKIADLGLAQVLGGEGVAIEEGMTLGTPNYFPPEQALVEGDLDCRTDMYALGATMYHLGTGEVPFSALSPEEVASQQVHGQMSNPKLLNKKLSWGFCCMVERLMAKDPLHRYDDWTGVMADIASVREGGMVKSPLASNIRSTVEHTHAPAPKKKKKPAGGPIVRSGGVSPASPRRRRGAPQRQQQVRVKRKTDGRAPVSGSKPINRAEGTPAASPSAPSPGRIRLPDSYPQTKRTLWPAVVALGITVGLLYTFTIMRSL